MITIKFFGTNISYIRIDAILLTVHTIQKKSFFKNILSLSSSLNVIIIIFMWVSSYGNLFTSFTSVFQISTDWCDEVSFDVSSLLFSIFYFVHSRIKERLRNREGKSNCVRVSHFVRLMLRGKGWIDTKRECILYEQD